MRRNLTENWKFFANKTCQSTEDSRVTTQKWSFGIFTMELSSPASRESGEGEGAAGDQVEPHQQGEAPSTTVDRFRGSEDWSATWRETTRVRV